MDLCPILLLKPHFVEKIWGGQKLAQTFSLSSNAPLGEAWLCSDLESHSSICTPVGNLENEAVAPLSRFVKRFKKNLVGTDSDTFPLLVKLIDAKQDLSVQVHPSESSLQRHPGAFAKDESWLILNSEGAVLHGLKDGTTQSAFEASIQNKNPESLLRRVPVERGDVLRVAPGTLHAILENVFLLEVQQPSDTTFRVWDYDRRDDAGQTRELHVEEALDVSNFDKQPHALNAQNALSDNCNAWHVEGADYAFGTLCSDEEATFVLSGESPLLFYATQELDIDCPRGSVTLRANECAIVPADAKRVYCKTRGPVIFAATSTRSVSLVSS